MSLIEPLLSDEAFVEEVRRVRASEPGLHLWWLGQSGYLLAWEGRALLLDPYLSDSLTRKYANTDKPHVRVSRQVIAPERLTGISVVTTSHNHTDHLDPETLRPLVSVNPGLRMVCPEANRGTVRERSGLADDRILGLETSPGRDRVTVDGFEFWAIPAAHEDLAVDSQGRPIYLGWVIQAGPWKVYHSGDTVLYPGMVAGLREQRVDVALLPINGRAPERRVAGNLNGREAAQVAKAIGAGCVVPGHYDLFAFNTASPEEFVNTCRVLDQPYRVLQLGERLTVG
ncbi:MAG: MBL fold metallo-hydrolase [Verrucomicrobia bacterium]|nr:MBL fold metallo-hydrolase [Verrucomicrobiota bacterium]